MCYSQNYSQESVKIIAEMFGLLYNKMTILSLPLATHQNKLNVLLHYIYLVFNVATTDINFVYKISTSIIHNSNIISYI